MTLLDVETCGTLITTYSVNVVTVCWKTAPANAERIIPPSHSQLQIQIQIQAQIHTLFRQVH